ncbi:MAG: hypothetical protein ACLPKZ_02270 [Acidimicrobiales bacterium]
MSTTKGSPNFGEQASSSSDDAPSTRMTLRDLYERASVSGRTLAAELNCALGFDDMTTTPSTAEAQSRVFKDEPSVHERALAAILEVVATNMSAPSDYVRTPEPPGGVQEWWARMLSGSMREPSSARSTISPRKDGE